MTNSDILAQKKIGYHHDNQSLINLNNLIP
jgi:hypothetical protein